MHFLGANRTLPTHSRAAGGQDVPSWFAKSFRTVIKLRGLEVCFIATYNLYNWQRIQEDMFVDI